MIGAVLCVTIFIALWYVNFTFIPELYSPVIWAIGAVIISAMVFYKVVFKDNR